MSVTDYFGQHFPSWANGLMIGGLSTQLLGMYGNLVIGVEQVAFFGLFSVMTAGLMRWDKTREDGKSDDDTPTDRLDKRHHNAPKDGNDDPVGITEGDGE